MLPRPSRLKSEAREFSPVLTTPPPVEPNTVLVFMSVPEMMLSSNFVPVRRRAAIRPAIPARITSAPAPSAHFGVVDTRSEKNPGASCAGAASGFGAGGLGFGASPAAGSTFAASAAGFAGSAAGAGVAAALPAAPLAAPVGAVAGAAGGCADAPGAAADAPAVVAVAAATAPPFAAS